MIIKQLTLATLDTGTLDFGFVGENEHIKYVIKCDSVYDEYPTATASLLIKAPDNTIYPKTVEVEGYNVGWVITASDTAYPGSGQIQLTFTEDGAVVKTVIANTNVKDSLVGDDPPPDPIADWISNANQILNKVDGMTATAESLPSGDDPSVTVETVDGHYNLEFGIPAGDPGDPTEIIDDNAGVGDTTKVWSANKSATDLSELKSDIDRKAPVINQTVSGDIISFADGADGMPLSSCVVSIDPVQSGSGDPAPDNVRPISGWTGANVYRTETPVNLGGWEQGAITGSNSTTNVGKTYSELKVSSTSRIRLSSLVSVDAAKTYAVFADSSKYDVVIQPYNSEGKSIRTYSGETWGAWVDTPVFLTGVPNYAIAIRKKNGADIVPGEISDVHLVVAERTTYPISWQTAAGTVYGGTVNPLTGKLVDFMGAKYTIDGSQTFGNVTNKVDSGGNAYTTARFALSQNAPNLSSGYANAVCSHASLIGVYYTWQNQDIPEAGRFSVNGSNMSVSVPGTYADSTALKAYFAANPWEVVYEKATKTEYTLSDLPTITTLMGYNAIWADTGAISLTYPADTQTYVDSAITAATDPDGNVVTVTGSTPSITGESGKRYVCGTVDSISITPPATGIIDVVFTSGTTPTVLTVPNTVKFPAWFDATSLDASTVYEINIQDGVYGAVSKWT